MTIEHEHNDTDLESKTISIEHEHIRTHLENLIFAKLSAFAESNILEDLRDKTVVCNESYDGKTKKDIIVVIKYLSATNTNGIVDLPIQILVDVKSDLQDLIFNVLQEIAYAENQQICSITDGATQNPTTLYKFKQFYNTPIVLTQFQNSGAYKSTTMTMDARFVIFTNIATSSDMYLKIIVDSSGSNPTSYTDDSTGINAFKNSILNTIYYIEHRFDGVNKATKRLQENKPNSYNITFTISYIFDSNSALQQDLWKNSTSAKMYTIEYKGYKGATPISNTQTFKCYLQSYTENVLVSDVTKVTVVFVSNGEV